MQASVKNDAIRSLSSMGDNIQILLPYNFIVLLLHLN